MPLMTFRHPITGVTREVECYLPRHFKALLLMNQKRFEIPVVIGFSGGGGNGASDRFSKTSGFDVTFYECHKYGSMNWVSEDPLVPSDVDGLRIHDEAEVLPNAVVGLFPRGLNPVNDLATGWSNGWASFENLPWDTQDDAWLIPMVEALDAGLRGMLSPTFLSMLATARGVDPAEVRVLDFTRIFLYGYSVGACMAFRAAMSLRGQICGFAAVNGSIGGFQNNFEAFYLPDAEVFNGPRSELRRGQKVHALIANARGDQQYTFAGGISPDNRLELEAQPESGEERIYGFDEQGGKQYARSDLGHVEAVQAWLLGNGLPAGDFTDTTVARDESPGQFYECRYYPSESYPDAITYPEVSEDPYGSPGSPPGAAPAFVNGPTVCDVRYNGGHEWPGQDLWLKVIWPWMRTRDPRD